MRIAVEGCAHGELETIYKTLEKVEKSDDKKIDLLICCGDFQSTRNLTDLSCMNVPNKYKDMCSFYKYYSGEKVAPILTIFIGGNHEASNYLQELPYGGWVAPNIYYLGYAGVVNVGGLRIAGISGIYKGHDFMKGHFESAPYTEATIRSVYHIRNLEVFRLKQLSGNIDIFLSHDWPNGITQFGDTEALLRNKPFLRSDVESNSLGSPPCMELLKHHYPSYWFSAHLHCKFAAAIFPEDDDTNSMKFTKFLALDKCLPKRQFIQIVEIAHDEKSPIKLSYDQEWLTILYLTNHLLNVTNSTQYMPGKGGSGRWIYTPTDTEKENIAKKLSNNFSIPNNFRKTCEPFDEESSSFSEPADLFINPQTTEFCDKLGIDDPSCLLEIINSSKVRSPNSSDNSPNTSCDREAYSKIIDWSRVQSNSSPGSSSAATTSTTSTDDSIDEYLSSSDQKSQIDEEQEQTAAAQYDKIIAINELVACEKSDEETVPTEPKKFRGRNHALYANTS